LEFGSYRSGVGGDKANPNEIVVKQISTEKIIERKSIINWDLTQHKDNYNDWITAFEKAISKRAKNGCFLGLSSGYDSGAIACELLKQKIDFKAYIYEGAENKEILRKREKLVKFEHFEPKKHILEWLKDNIDDEKLTILYNNKETDMTIISEQACAGVGTMCDLARKEGRKVCLSSQGADEILSDYMLFPDQSELITEFPKELELWPNFNYSCQESYLMKEEYAGGAFNIETRYPFLDADLVQEFLWLKPELKNRHYKAPLREYLVRNNFPFEEGVKRGFSVNI
jgi:asparagine synthetase B (glutamine-hydrolysing)